MKGAKLFRWSAIAVGCWLGGQAHAAVNLALHCKTAISGTAVCDAGAMRWVTPSSTSRVKVEGSGWAMFDTTATGAKLAVCAADIPTDSLYAACTQLRDVPKCEVAGQTCTAVVNTTGNIVLAWTLPTQNTDNTPLTDLAGVWIYSGSPLVKLKQIAKPATTTTLTGYADGTYQFTLSAITTAGVESAQTGPASVKVKLPTTPVPNPPTLTVVEAIAYRYDQGQVDKPRLFAIGTVPLGTTCDAKYYVLGLYRVPRVAVTFTKGAGANIPLAKCG